jgi:hypothetical protein
MNYDCSALEDLQSFEKIARRNKAFMPVHRDGSSLSAAHKSPKSKRLSRQISQSNGGKHRRRLRRVR